MQEGLLMVGGAKFISDLESSSLVKVEKGFSLETVKPKNSKHGQASQDFLWPLSVT